MKVEFQPVQIQGLSCVLQEVTDGEQTQELRLPEGMPDIARVIGAWGQGILRSKQWHRDHISCSCGMEIRVLYEAEGQEPLQMISSWIPFQLCWDMEPVSVDGDIRISLLTRFVDARTVSPRKILVRAGLAGLADARVSRTWELPEPVSQKQIPVLEKKHTVRLWKSSGEKSFVLDEEVTLPESAPVMQKILYSYLDPGTSDCRVAGDKVAFRGQCRLHVLYQSDSQQVHSWDFQIPYSQYAQLKEVYGNDAECDIRFAVTSLEADLQDNGSLRLKCGVTGQYLISEKQTVTVLEDAYHPAWDLELKTRELNWYDVKEKMKRSVPVRQDLPEDGNMVPDAMFFPDFPLVQEDGANSMLCLPGFVQVLYYDPEGKLHSTVSRWEGREPLPDKTLHNCTWIPHVVDMQAAAEADGIKLKGEMLLSGFVEEDKRIPMVQEVAVGKERVRNSPQPSVILLRCGKESLWDIAKGTGSTVEHIMAANGLEGECEPGKLLLIPLGS